MSSSIVLKYIFNRQSLKAHLLRGLLFLSVYFSVSSFCFAQPYTQRDQAEIQYLAQLTLIEYENILNLVSNAGISESVIADVIENAYSNPNTRIFYAPDVKVADNLRPSGIDATEKQVLGAKEYIREFHKQYVKSELETVDFYDFQISNLKSAANLYVRVKYTAHFKGRHRQDVAPYKAHDRVAELRVEKKGNRWVTYIAGITFHDPALPIASTKEDVKLNASIADDGTFSQKLNELKLAQQAQRQNVNDAAIARSWEAYDNKRFEEVRLLGQKAEAVRDYAKARQFYAQALQIKPEDPALKSSILKLDKSIQTMELLEAKYQSGQYMDAIKAYGQAISEDPENPRLYWGRGRAYEKLNEFQTAIQDYSKAIKLNNNFTEALASRAVLHVRAAQPKKALEDYNQIIQNQQDAAAYYSERAKVKVSLNDFKGALEDYSAAVKLNPDVAAFDYEKGLIHYQLKQLEQAIEAFSAATTKDPQLAKAYYARGLAYVDNHNMSAAAVDFEKAREIGLEKEQLASIDSIAAGYSSLGDKAMQKADYKTALTNYIKLVLFSPADADAWLKKGDAHFELQDYQNALQSYTRAIALKSVSLAYYKRGLTYRQLKDDAAAKNDFLQFIPVGRQLISSISGKAEYARNPQSQEQLAQESAEAWYTLGIAQQMAEKYDDALVSLEKALEINKAYAQALYARGAVQHAMGNYKKAIKDIEKSIKWGIKDKPEIYLTLGDAYQAIGQIDYSIEIYSYLINSVDQRSAQAYRHRAASFKMVKQYQLALQDIKTALSLDETLNRDVAFITNKGILELYDSRLQEADHSFDQALSLEQNNAWALYGKASVLASQNKIEESLPLYQKAFQTKEIEWSAIKDDPIIRHMSKQKAFKDLVDASLRL